MDSDMKKLLTSFCTIVAMLVTSIGAAQWSGSSSAPVSGTQTQPPQAIVNRSSDYVVGAQDLIKITVFDEPTMSGSYRVDTDGSFQYPMLGRVAVGGMRIREVEQMLKTKLEDGYIKRAQVAVDVEQFRSRSIFVVGEVRTPGKYLMTAQMSLIEALAAAGSTTATASSEVMILRPRDAGSAQALTPEQVDQNSVTRVNLADLQLGRLSQNVALVEGDTIFVPKADKFFITGQVRSPGAYTFERGLTVLQAISLAGGLTEKGSSRRIKVVRSVKGKKTQQGIDLADAIQPGDTLVIPQRLL
jgi:Periplasmic protein involved in polysaccharide export